MSYNRRKRWPRLRLADTIVVSMILPFCSDTGCQMSDAFVVLAPPHVSTVHARMPRSTEATVATASLDGVSHWRTGGVRGFLHGFSYRIDKPFPRCLAAGLESGAGAGAPDGGGGYAPGTGVGMEEYDAEMGMAPVDMDQAMGSFSPEWGNNTDKADPRTHLIKGSVISANQTAFPYAIDSFPPRINSEVYYNGTSERFWWNQDQDSVCVYVPVPRDFDVSSVEFVAKTTHISLKLNKEEILSGTPFYRIDGYESLYVVDLENDPPYVQLELYKFREYQNWEDLLLEGSRFSPRGAG